MFQTRKIVIIGAGHVGSHCAYSLAAHGACDEIVLIDIDEDKAIAQALDISDSVNYLPHRVDVHAGGYDELADADILVVSAGPLPDAHQTRMDSLGKTVEIMKTIVPKIKSADFKGILISISNPADVVAHYLQANLGLPAKRVISTSTTLDSARLHRVLSDRTGIDRRSIQAYVMGEHGESQMVAWSNASIAGKPLSDWMKKYPDTWGKLNLDEIAAAAKKGGWTILHGKHSTEFGIGTSLCEIVKTIYHNDHKILPVSVLLDGQYGQRDVYASVPTVLGKDGVEEIVEIDLTPEELSSFAASCDVMRKNFELTKTM